MYPTISKFQTVKFSKNFNVKISMKFSRRKNFMKLYISSGGTGGRDASDMQPLKTCSRLYALK